MMGWGEYNSGNRVASGGAGPELVLVGIKRGSCNEIHPLLRSIIGPNENQGFDYFADWRVLRNDQEDPRTLAASLDKLRKLPRHRALVVAHKNPALFRSALQYQMIAQTIQSGCLCGLKINAWPAA